MWGEMERSLQLAFGPGDPLISVWSWLRPFLSWASFSPSVKWGNSPSSTQVLYGFYATLYEACLMNCLAHGTLCKHGLSSQPPVQLPPSTVGLSPRTKSRREWVGWRGNLYLLSQIPGYNCF